MNGLRGKGIRENRRHPIVEKSALVSLVAMLALPICAGAQSPTREIPGILSVRDRARIVTEITRKRLDTLLPGFMRQTGLDMWIIICNEDNHDPVFNTMIPYKHWCPITQILVFSDRGPDKGVEKLNLSRSALDGMYDNAWDYKAWDTEEKESQWDCLRRIVHERDPRRIGINVGQIQWAAGGLTVVLKNKLVETIEPKYAARLESAEPLVTLWCETLLEEEIEFMERASAISHAVIAETFSSKVITPGYTTTDDLRFHYWQRVTDLGLDVAFHPFVAIRGRSPENVEKYGADDNIIRPGDFIRCDVGLKYMHYMSDHQEWAYVLRAGETDVPETFKKMMTEGNRLQDVFCGEFKAGLSGNELLTNIHRRARQEGIPNPKIYSHSLGYFLHETGPLIGLPWEQVFNPGWGDVKLVYNSCFAAEMSIAMPVPEWGKKLQRFPLEENIAFTRDGVVFLDGRQTQFHLVR